MAVYQPNMDMMGNQGWYNQMIVVDELDTTRNTIYIGGLYSSAKTTDGGLSWQLMSMWLRNYYSLPYVHGSFHTGVFVTSPSYQRALVVGTDGGLSMSYDNGGHWNGEYANRGLSTHLVNYIAGSPRYPSALLIGLQSVGTLISLDGSSNFNAVLGSDGDGCGTSQAVDAVTIMSNDYNTFYCTYGSIVSLLSAAHYPCYTGIDGTETAMYYSNLITPTARADPTGTIFFTATAQSIYKSSISGGKLTWSKIATNGLSGLTTDPFRDTVHMMGIGITSITQIAVCKVSSSGNAALAITIDGGLSWNEISFTTWSSCSAPIWATSDGSTLYVSSTYPSPGNPRLLKSTDSGSTWKPAQNGLIDAPVLNLVVDPADQTGSTLYAATWIGVYITSDGGGTWYQLGSELPNVPVYDMYLNGRMLYAGTYGRSVWKIDLSVIPTTSPSTPSLIPTSSPSLIPTRSPSLIPTRSPSIASSNPTLFPTSAPTKRTVKPSRTPSYKPTKHPTRKPTSKPKPSPIKRSTAIKNMSK